MSATEPSKFQVWNTSFSAEQREEQIEADKEAWRGIVGILLAIVIMGVTMATFVVLAISAWG